MTGVELQQNAVEVPRPERPATESTLAKHPGAVLGHELRNPLASALTNVAMASELTEVTDPRAPILARALDDLERVGALLDRYLELSARRRTPREAVDLVAFCRAFAGERVLVKYCPGLASAVVSTDAVLLERALDNLVDNACKSGATNVTISLLDAEDGIVVEVVDDGPGISSQIAKQMFQPFVTAGSAPGTGLGLAIVSEVLEALGGRAENLPVTTGACFRLVLPR